MNIKEHQINTIQALIANEKTIGELYRAYSDIFPDYKEFWFNLGAEEFEHASWIQSFSEKKDDKAVYFNQGRFNVGVIETFLKYTKEQISRATNERVGIVSALATALDIEKSILEKNYFEIFEGDSVELKHLLMALSEATKVHRQKIEKALEEEKNKL